MDRYIALERSFRNAGIYYHLAVHGGPWSWEGKVRWELDMVRRYPKDHFVFIDAFDYLFVGDPDRLREIATSRPLIFSTDRGERPWPHPHYDVLYDQRRTARTPWRWLNGSGPTGSAEAIREAIESRLDKSPFFEPGTDQLFWTEVYLQGYGELDQDCKLTLTLWGSDEGDYTFDGKKIINNITGTSPQFIHATGQSWCWIPEELIPCESKS
jgi:hypothetical protein